MKYKNLKIKLLTGNPPAPKLYSYEEYFNLIAQLKNSAQLEIAASLATDLADKLLDDYNAQKVAAECLILNGNPRAALSYVSRADATGENPIYVLMLQSRISLALNDSERAIAYIDSAIAMQPENSSLYQEKGDLLGVLGDTEGSKQNYLNSINKNIGNITSIVNLSMIPGYEFPQAVVTRIEQLARSGKLTGQKQAYAHFTLAGIYEKKELVREAFLQLDKGNAILSKLNPYNPEANRRLVHDIARHLTRALIESTNLPPGNEQRFIFIVGMPRSGSTLIEQILSSHSEVAAAGENPHLKISINEFSNQSGSAGGYPFCINENTLGELSSIALNYLERIKGICVADVITDKTLDNYLFIGLLKMLFPNAKFIDVRRHPSATCYGCYKKIFAPGSVAYSYDLNHLACAYQDYLDIMSHWNQILPGDIMTLNYEDLIDDQVSTTKDLLNFCGLPWQEACLQFQDNSRNVMTASNYQVRQKLYKSAVNHWQKYAEYLGPVMGLSAREAR